MSIMDKARLERATKVAQVIAEHPDLPMMCLAPSTPSDYDTYYHDVYGASVEGLLRPLEVEGLYGGLYGLNPERYYTDMDEVAEDIEDWLWDNTDVDAKTLETDIYGMRTRVVSFDMREWEEAYRPIARMMAEDMPWQECIVIDCY